MSMSALLVPPRTYMAASRLVGEASEAYIPAINVVIRELKSEPIVTDMHGRRVVFSIDSN